MEAHEVLQLWVVEWSAESNSFNIHRVHEAIRKNKGAFDAFVEDRERWQHWIPLGLFADKEKARAFSDKLHLIRNADLDQRQALAELQQRRHEEQQTAELRLERQNQMRRDMGLPPLPPDDE